MDSMKLESLKFEFIKASRDCLPGMLDLLHLIYETITEPEWFRAGDAEFFRSCIDECGFTVAAYPVADIHHTSPPGPALSPDQVTDRIRRPAALAGFFSVHFPGLEEHNMGNYLQMSDSELMKVAHMDTAVVAPAYRGHHLQRRMLEAAEELLSDMPHRYLMATVHPDNHYSLENMMSRGYRIVDTREMYGGVIRHVLLKEI